MEMIMHEETIKKLQEELSEGGWHGSFDDLNAIIKRLIMFQDIHTFIELAKIRYSVNGFTNPKPFEELEQELIKAADEYTGYLFLKDSVMIMFSNNYGPQAFVEYNMGSMVYNTTFEPIRKKGFRHSFKMHSITIENNTFTYTNEQDIVD